MNKEAYLQGFNEYKKGVFEMIEKSVMKSLNWSYVVEKEYYDDLEEDEKEEDVLLVEGLA